MNAQLEFHRGGLEGSPMSVSWSREVRCARKARQCAAKKMLESKVQKLSSMIDHLKQQLDREQVAGLAFSVRVLDHGTPQLGATARVKLNTVDMNDNAPTFSRPSYEFAVVENLAPDTLVGVVAAADGDSGRNGEISFSLKTASSQFRIESSSGRTAGPARPLPVINLVKFKIFLSVTI